MSRSTLKALAVILTALIIVVLFAGLDKLPGGLRAKIDSERTAVSAAEKQVQAAKSETAQLVNWPDRFAAADADLHTAVLDMADLSRLEKQNRRSDRDRVESLLAHERQARTKALAAAADVRSQATRWADRRNHLPQEIEAMEHDYKAIQAFDLTPVTVAVERAETAWPEKKAHLDSRLAALRAMVAESDRLYESRDQEPDRVLAAADALKASATDLPKQAANLQGLTSQLYDSWDKILVDMEVRGIGSAREYDQKIRTVRTHQSTTTSDEQWVTVSKAAYDSMHNDLGMAIEHKPAGRYDFEAERVAQPAGFAYVAPPGQANQYGQWEHHDGRDFWVFYGQYALLRDLLFNHDYRPVDRGEWENYRTSRQNNQTYYGHDYGTQGAATQDRYKSSTYARSGGFRDSEFASKPGGYRSSPYSSPSAREPNGDHSAKTFGHSSRPSEPRAAPPPRPYHPAPAPFRPRSMPGRRFGRR